MRGRVADCDVADEGEVGGGGDFCEFVLAVLRLHVSDGNVKHEVRPYMHSKNKIREYATD